MKELMTLPGKRSHAVEHEEENNAGQRFHSITSEPQLMLTDFDMDGVVLVSKINLRTDLSFLVLKIISAASK